ncbi:MAG: 6-carboxytetrahydropterin synthase [Phycisphaerales bacterium]|nr:6-carboxytetrahydropterin synthase [Phycisphaerales bacterium]
MYELTVEREFCAAHAIVIGGRLEPLHGHNWRVRITVTGEKLDSNGLLCDFHAIESRLDRVIAPLHNGNLNTTPPFDQINPTAEHVARHIAEAMSAALPRNVRLSHATVTEAPGCSATYRPARSE